MSPEELSPKQKAAVLMISLGSDTSAEVMKHLSEEEIEQLTLEIANVQKVDTEQREDVLNEFHQMAVAQDYISQGGINYAKEVLERALGSQKAMNIIDRLTSSLQVKPFEFMRKTEPSQVINFIQNEHPQTIALILAYLQPEQSSMILSALPSEKQVDVARRIAVMERTSPEIIKEVEQILERKLSSVMTQDYTSAGGISAIVDVLNNVDRATEKTILENLETEDPDLAEEIKKRLFVFDDIVLLDDRSIQRVIREVEQKDLTMALKVAGDEVKDRVFKNMSKRMSDLIKEEMDYMGPVRLRDVEESQQKIVNLIRSLEESGEIVIARGKEDEVIV
ncbi:flagellar motor switch protein FliG [Natranaerobius thermophilus]|uniref:Flagellar motor switch protein FliG n=1 Tax=Natranaerobius thermophilus (strain ATCC BAA-1301 / DSM 18059 / JW/NM-WN-LF) TaxID=457570 RepID=B2A344_NATTJ|nr:flagellar motor switch protein FliG [Natranaerobius thermophilus]ACB84975.1 flagellar motor switch protein FliG [Natranaerobius thermophilus JW/NM-WN-LF]